MLAAASLGGLVATCGHPAPRPASGGATLSDTVDYNFHVRPILSDKCFACHGPDARAREGDFRLDLADSAYQALPGDPERYPIMPGRPEASEVYRRITASDTTERMPPAGSNLTLLAHEIKVIERWIKQGAQYKPHWAFVPPVALRLPSVQQTAWVKNEIDYFILHRLEQVGFTPNPEADKAHLLRRVTLDLTGLPPTLEEQDAFLADTSATAYERVVDALLARPAYGERMAVPWLDVARYADSHGYSSDEYRSMWPWRDWVIHAFNQNMPYDQFVTWQLAGDLLPQATNEQILATGFNRNHKITEEGGIIDEEYRLEYVTDRTNTFGKSFLGVTMECAKCHDHKYDPIAQREYYQLFAFFNNVPEVGSEGSDNMGHPEAHAKRPYLEISDADVRGSLRFIHKPAPGAVRVSVMGERDSLRQTYILKRGQYDQPTTPVVAGTPQAILPFDATAYPRNRLGLAQWLFDPKNPLTARVFVNRMWQEVFGRGLVKTPGDFGVQGALPSHPELLDWLAVDVTRHGWNMKRLMKQLLMSGTYRQSAVVTREKLAHDPENVYLARAPRVRLPAEFIRDLVLATSGLLVPMVGGPSVRPYQPAGLWEAAAAFGTTRLRRYEQDHGTGLYRRGLYTFMRRVAPPPSMLVFDASNREQCEVGRLTTSTPLQALVMLNDPTVLEAARVLAARLLQERTTTDAKITKAFRLIVSRPPAPAQLDVLRDYYQDRVAAFTREPAKAQQVLAVGEAPRPRDMPAVPLAALMQVVTAIYNLDDAITKF